MSPPAACIPLNYGAGARLLNCSSERWFFTETAQIVTFLGTLSLSGVR